MSVTAVPGTATRPFRLLFVCTANVARSPYAERRARVLFRDRPLVFASAGMPGYPGRAMDVEMASQLRLRGGDPEGHVSRSLGDQLMAQADVVLTFEFGQHMRVFEAWPEHVTKVFGLNQFTDALAHVGPVVRGASITQRVLEARRSDSMTWDIADPHGRGVAAARRCADEIDDVLTRLGHGLMAQGQAFLEPSGEPGSAPGH